MGKRLVEAESVLAMPITQRQPRFRNRSVAVVNQTTLLMNETAAIIDYFRAEGSSFLTPYGDAPIEPGLRRVSFSGSDAGALAQGQAIAAGVQCIEHAHLMDDATARMMAEKGVWLSMQPLPEDLRLGFPVGSVQRAKADEVWPGIARTYELAKKYKIKTAFGTDILFSPGLAQRHGELLAKLKQAGMQVNEVDKNAFIKASAGIYEDFGKEVAGAKPLIDKAVALGK